MMDNLVPLAAAVVIVLAGLALLAALVVVAVRALRMPSMRTAVSACRSSMSEIGRAHV